MIPYLVPLGQRRRFGPAPVETAPPQLAQPSPSAFPRAPDQDSPGKRPREEMVTPVDGKSKPALQPRSLFET
jgi:splicing factor 1